MILSWIADTALSMEQSITTTVNCKGRFQWFAYQDVVCLPGCGLLTTRMLFAHTLPKGLVRTDITQVIEYTPILLYFKVHVLARDQKLGWGGGWTWVWGWWPRSMFPNSLIIPKSHRYQMSQGFETKFLTVAKPDLQVDGCRNIKVWSLNASKALLSEHRALVIWTQWYFFHFKPRSLSLVNLIFFTPFHPLSRLPPTVGPRVAQHPKSILYREDKKDRNICWVLMNTNQPSQPALFNYSQLSLAFLAL